MPQGPPEQLRRLRARRKLFNSAYLSLENNESAAYVGLAVEAWIYDSLPWPEQRPAKFVCIDDEGLHVCIDDECLHEAWFGPDDFE
jgi:hypothetical protein